MINKAKDYSDDFVEAEYATFKAHEVYKHTWIKMIAGLLLLLYFSYVDISINQSIEAFYNRILNITLAVAYLVLHVSYFRKNKRYVVFFYNTVLCSIVLMIYGIAIVYYGTPLFAESTEGAVLVIAIVSIELRGKIKTSLVVFIVPTLIMLFLLLLNDKVLSTQDIVHLSHILTMVIIGTIYTITREHLNLQSFKDKLQLQFEKQKSEELSDELISTNERLNVQNAEIAHQRDITQTQNILLENQKSQITSSIVYAKNIQKALFSTDANYDDFFSEHFVIYRPKDIVSGDFYWSVKKGDTILFALADCTGHGVPAAFMSVLGISFLNEITFKQEELRVNIILNELRNFIIHSLKQTNAVMETKDGMDMSICAYDAKTNKLSFAGAKSRAFLITKKSGKKELVNLKGDGMPVSIYYKMKPFDVQEHYLVKGDTLYLFTDGFPDQFGGIRGKKLKMSNFRKIIEENADLPLTEQKRVYNQFLDCWMTNDDFTHAQNDDISLLALRV